MKQKILFILPTLHAGGAENYSLRFINHYKDKFDFFVLSVNEQKGILHDKFEKAGATIIYQSIGYFSISKIQRLYKLIKSLKIDTVCTFTGNFGGIPLMTAKNAGVKKRVAFYRRSTNAFGNNYLKLLYNKLATFAVRKYATDILSNSQFAFQNFHPGYYPNDPRFIVVPNGVNWKDFDIALTKKEARKMMSLQEDNFIIGHVGRYDSSKNHPTIFKVVKKIQAQNENIKFVFCGKGTDSPEFKNTVEAAGISESVIGLGLQDNLPVIYKCFDLFYFPSVTEGQPNALIEAMLSGLPVVVSNIPPILEAIPENKHEFALSPKDSDAAASMIQKVIDDNNTAEDFVYQEWAKAKFDPEINFKLFETTLQNGK